MEESPEGTGGVQSVGRALDLLEALADGTSGLVELSRQTGLSASTTHRLLATLVRHGYARRDIESGRYLLGYRTLKLSYGIEQGIGHAKEALRPFMRTVQLVSGETTNLSVLQGPDIVHVAQLLKSDNECWVEPGRNMPAHATAAGNAMLAFMPPQTVYSLLSSTQMRAYTRRTITCPDSLMSKCREVRETGWALSREELSDYTTCIAAPVFDATGRVVAALSISTRTRRLERVAPMEEFGELVGRTAMEASEHLGYDGSSQWQTV